MRVCTSHQLNFLLPLSVVDRIRRADVVIWLDQAQYVRHSWVNRNRLSDNAWMTVPVSEHDTFAPINRVQIADPTGRARAKIARKLDLELGDAGARFAEILRRPYELLGALNFALIQALLDELGIQVEHTFQSLLDKHHPVLAVSDDEEQLLPLKERFADMAAQLGATVWLSGPGRHHGDPARFASRGIRIEYAEWDGPNPSAVELLRERVAA